MSDKIRVITDKSNLKGTCYIELSLGKYQGNHWEETNLFLEEESFGFIEPIIEKLISNYDHYGVCDVTRAEWKAVILELEKLNDALSSAKEFRDIRDHIGFFGFPENEFQAEFESRRNQLQDMISEFVDWLTENLKSHDHIAILGL